MSSYDEKRRGFRLHEPLSDSEKKRIIELKLSGRFSQIEIACMFRVHPTTILRTLREAGVGRYATLTPELEAEAVRLLKEGMGQGRVAKQLRLSSTTVHEIYLKNGIQHGAARLTPEEEVKIAEAVGRHEDYMANLAHKFNRHRDTIRKRVDKVLGPVPLLRGNRVTPLTSNFPQRDVQLEMAKRIQRNMAALEDECRLSVFDEPELVIIRSEDAAEIVNLVIARCFEGQMPADFIGLAKLLTERSIELVPREMWNKLNSSDQITLTNRLGTEFLLATNALRKAERYESHVVH